MGTPPEPVTERYSTLRGLGWAALAIILYVAMVDAAVETALRGAPSRWIVAGVVAAYAAVAVLLWRRTTWASRATVSFFVLIGLLAFSAWLPGGTTQGITLAGQPTTTVLAFVSAAIVLAAGVAIVSMASLPVAARAILGALAAYGVGAFLLGIAAGTSYPALLHGASLWTRLPFWLQGAFVGALIVTPAAILLQVGKGLRRSPGAPFHGPGLQVLALGAGVLLAVAGLRAPAGTAVASLKFADRAEPVRVAGIVFARGESGGQPVGPSGRFEVGVKTIYAFLSIEGVKGDDKIGAVWSLGAATLYGQQVFPSQVSSVSSGRGRLWFSIEFQDGAAPGGYFLEITVNGRLAQSGNFAIEPKR